MANHQDRGFEDVRNALNEYARILVRRWRLALVGLGIVSSVAFWCSQYLPRQYRATTLFERHDDVVLRNLIQSNSPYSFGNLKSTIRLDMTGMRALADAAISIGILPPEAVASGGALTNEEMQALDAVLGRYKLSANLNMIQSSANLDTIQLSCEANHPDVAGKFVVALRDRYISQTCKRITEVLSSTKEFFESQAQRFDEQVAQSNHMLQQQFSEFPGVDPADPNSAGARLEALQMERDRLLQRHNELEAQVTTREQFLVSSPTYVADRIGAEQPAPTAAPPDEFAARTAVLDGAIRKIEQDIADAIMISRMTPEHPKVKTLYRKLAGLRATRQEVLLAAAQQPPPLKENDPAPSGPPSGETYAQWNSQRVRVELELQALRKQLEIAKAGHAEADERLAKFSQLFEQLLEKTSSLRRLQDQLQQDAAMAAVWRQHLGQLSRVLVAEAGERGTKFSLIEQPKEVTRPMAPRVASIFPICSGFGLAAAALLVALAELFDRSFNTVGQVTRVLGIPVLECVESIPTPRERRRRLVSRAIWAPALGLLLLALVTTSSLAYASLAKPGLHRRVIQRLDRALTTVGVPPTNLHDQSR